MALNSFSNAINKFERRISREKAVRAGKRFTLFFEDMNDIKCKTVKVLENTSVYLMEILKQ